MIETTAVPGATANESVTLPGVSANDAALGLTVGLSEVLTNGVPEVSDSVAEETGMDSERCAVEPARCRDAGLTAVETLSLAVPATIETVVALGAPVSSSFGATEVTAICPVVGRMTEVTTGREAVIVSETAAGLDTPVSVSDDGARVRLAAVGCSADVRAGATAPKVTEPADGAMVKLPVPEMFGVPAARERLARAGRSTTDILAVPALSARDAAAGATVTFAVVETIGVAVVNERLVADGCSTDVNRALIPESVSVPLEGCSVPASFGLSADSASVVDAG